MRKLLTTPVRGIARVILLPAAILVVLLGLSFLVLRNPPVPARVAAPPAPKVTVDVLELHRRAYQVRLQSYGMVQPRTQSKLVSQVFGEITAIDDSLRDGGFFEQGAKLLTIDQRDYRSNIKIAEASLAEARGTLIEEQARSAQALEDWKRLDNRVEAPDLVLRKPQLATARARVASAAAALDKARLELERTNVIAPYAGRVRAKLVDVGQVVDKRSELAEIYAVDYVEIRLPLRNRDLAYINLPEDYRFATDASPDATRVSITSEIAGGSQWQGKVVRTEGAVDDRSRQLHVVVQVDDPFGARARDKTPLKIGQYVMAEVEGRQLEDALVIPNRAIYQGGYVYCVEDGVLQRRDIDIAWQNEVEALVGGGLEAGDLLVLTPLGQVTSGVRVTIAERQRQR